MLKDNLAVAWIFRKKKWKNKIFLPTYQRDLLTTEMPRAAVR